MNLKVKKVTVKWDVTIGRWYDRPLIKSFLNSFYVQKLMMFIHDKYQKGTVYPNKIDVFRAFRCCEPKDLRIVIIGQDPYHDGRATGLAFANNNLVTRPSPSLNKIMKKVEKDFNTLKIDEDITLQTWAAQGILLLNTALTVEKGNPNSHKKPWAFFIKFFIKHIAETMPGTIFMLWGKQARTYEKFDEVDLNDNCYVLKAEHPAYAHRQHREWKCDNFIEANKILKQKHGREFCIEW